LQVRSFPADVQVTLSGAQTRTLHSPPSQISPVAAQSVPPSTGPEPSSAHTVLRAPSHRRTPGSHVFSWQVTVAGSQYSVERQVPEVVNAVPSWLHVAGWPASLQNELNWLQTSCTQAPPRHTLPSAAQSRSMVMETPSAEQVLTFCPAASHAVVFGVHTWGTHVGPLPSSVTQALPRPQEVESQPSPAGLHVVRVAKSSLHAASLGPHTSRTHSLARQW
jgi:hypothetical protein